VHRRIRSDFSDNRGLTGGCLVTAVVRRRRLLCDLVGKFEPILANLSNPTNRNVEAKCKSVDVNQEEGALLHDLESVFISANLWLILFATELHGISRIRSRGSIGRVVAVLLSSSIGSPMECLIRGA
jgi:hypothetical protein